MFKYAFACSDEDRIRTNVKQMMSNDSPCGKSLFGGDLYGPGVHFQECGEVIRGFYLDVSENEAHRGSPIRVRFRGRFVRDKDDNLFFKVYIYPRVPELLFLIYAFVFFFFWGNLMGNIVYALVLIFFIKGYYDMIKGTCNAFNWIFR